MTFIRSFSLAAVSLVLVSSLSGCFGFPGAIVNQGGSEPAPGGGSTNVDSLAGTTWSGVDSDGDSWSFDFQEDGTVGLTLNGDSYDDATDTWGVSGSTLTITVVFSDGTAIMTGQYAPGASSIDLDGAQDDIRWTLSITQM